MDKIIKLIEKEAKAKGNQDYVTALHDISLQVDLELIKIMERKGEEEREKATLKVPAPTPRWRKRWRNRKTRVFLGYLS